MSKRPYFRYGIEQLQELSEKSKNDLEAMKDLQFELGHRHVPRAQVLKRNVDNIVQSLEVGVNARPVDESRSQLPEHALPERVAVECAHCNTQNFVSVIDGTQYLSCSSCKLPYTVTYKYGLLRTHFSPIATKPKFKPSTGLWIVIGILLVIVTLLILKQP